MAELKADELSSRIDGIISTRLRSLRIPRAKSIAADLVPQIMLEIPTEVFDPDVAWRHGKIFFHGDVTTKSARKMQDFLYEVHLNTKKTLPFTIYLSSGGGIVSSAVALVATIRELRRQGRHINIHVCGEASSIASYILQAGEIRSMEPDAFLMLHEIYDDSLFDSKDIDRTRTSSVQDAAKSMEKMERIIYSAYAARTSKNVEYYRKKMHRRNWELTAQEALAEELVDKIASIPRFAKLK